MGRPATSDGGAWLPDNEIPPTPLPVLEIFFQEMWPILRSSVEKLRAFIAGPDHELGSEVPRKSFTTTPGFEALQTGDGPLCHDFRVAGVPGRRMVVPYQVWILQRVAGEISACTADPHARTAIVELLGGFPSGGELLALDERLAGVGLRKDGGRLFSIAE